MKKRLSIWFNQNGSIMITFANLGLLILVAVLLLGGSSLVNAQTGDRARAFTRQVEFDFVDWVAQALIYKIRQGASESEKFLSLETRKALVLEMLDLVYQSWVLENQIETIYADPQVQDPKSASSELTDQLHTVKTRLDQIQPIAEAVIQSQVSDIVAEMGLTVAGQPVPPVLYHSTPLPYAMIISPRDVISQEADVSLAPELELDQIVELEEKVASELDVSTLVVPIGGVGVYPTMVYQTNNLVGLSEVVSHEWIHNFLTLRPLGMNYLSSPELRIINETTASIAGKEIGLKVIEKYYPEFLPPPAPTEPPPETSSQETEQEPVEPVFNYREEMRITRLRVDELLAEGQIEQAEQYMEERRIFFWENGYRIRKLNQAFFAFYGAYADQPGGASGEDPVGAAVRKLRDQSDSLAEFLKKIAWMTSFEELQRSVN
jgi:hypothetical protein